MCCEYINDFYTYDYINVNDDGNDDDDGVKTRKRFMRNKSSSITFEKNNSNAFSLGNNCWTFFQSNFLIGPLLSTPAKTFVSSR